MRELVNTEAKARKLLERVQRADAFGFDTESSGPPLIGPQGPKKMVNVHRSELTGFSLGFLDRHAFYVPARHDYGNLPEGWWRKILRAILESRARIWVHNIKHEDHVLAREGLVIPYDQQTWHDSLLSHWILDRPATGRKPYSLKALALQNLGSAPETFERVAKGRLWKELPPEEAVEYATDDALNTLFLGEATLPEMHQAKLLNTLLNVEVPFAGLLAAMERRGMSIDSEGLTALADRLEARMFALEDEWAWTWPSVSITSPKQIGDYFFGNRLWPTKGVERTPKTKALKTNREAFDLALTHPRTPPEGRRAAEIKVEYQDAAKIVSTYSRTLVAMASQYPDGRLHPNALQHGTVTGRISMEMPNLMNIPVRSELGKLVKGCFVPGEGRQFVTADYSQIELRVLAHFAPTGSLFDAYNTGADIHQRTADATRITRDMGKKLNFTYIYGARPRKISKTLGVGLDRAKRIYADYEKAYPEVVEARDRAVRRATETGMVRTLGGNIRRLPNITSGDWGKRMQAERIAFNTVVQGSAAYLVKLGMLRAQSRGLRIVGQVHDEVLTEESVSWAEAPEVLREALQTAYPLRVPLIAEPSTGRNWLEAK